MEEEIGLRLGATIRAWRKKGNLTIGALAELADIDAGFLTYIEAGKKLPSLPTLVKIAKALNIPVAALFDKMPVDKRNSNYIIGQQLNSLLHDRSASEQTDLLAVIKRLKNDPQTLKAIKRLIRR